MLIKMNEIKKLLDKLIIQADVARDIETYAKSKKIDELAADVREEAVCLQKIDARKIRDEFYNAQKAFRNSLTDEQKRAYAELEALSNVIQMLNGRE